MCFKQHMLCMLQLHGRKFTIDWCMTVGCRAPHLFAAVLQQAGAGRELLPLLADPARAAFQGLSITARHNRAFHVFSFLQASLPRHCLSSWLLSSQGILTYSQVALRTLGSIWCCSRCSCCGFICSCSCPGMSTVHVWQTAHVGSCLMQPLQHW